MGEEALVVESVSLSEYEDSMPPDTMNSSRQSGRNKAFSPLSFVIRKPTIEVTELTGPSSNQN